MQNKPLVQHLKINRLNERTIILLHSCTIYSVYTVCVCVCVYIYI